MTLEEIRAKQKVMTPRMRKIIKEDNDMEQAIEDNRNR